jgi:hypothetical protein
VVTVLSLLTQFRRRWLLFWLSLVQYGLIHLQLRLGLGSNGEPELLSYHVPLGVLISFLSYLTMAVAFVVRFDSGRT